jgi:hypothetical protein
MMYDSESTQLLGKILEPLLNILKRFGGYYLFRSHSGEQYVIMSRSEFDRREEAVSEHQLPLPAALSAASSAGDVLERINREIALYQLQQAEEDVGEEPEAEEQASQLPAQATMTTIEVEQTPPRRIRFEPLRGDLPPELQE